MKPIAKTTRRMRGSGIREIMDLAAGRPEVVHLEVGEPDFPTPAHVVDAAARAAKDGFTKYTANRGLVEVREAMARKIYERNGFEVPIDQIVVTTGAVNGIVQAFMVFCDPGDVLLLPDLAWPNYEVMATLLDLPVRRYPLVPEAGFTPDLEALDQVCATTRGAKVLVLNSPGNPTGGVFDREVVEGILEIAARHDLYVVSDECYEDIIFEGEHVSPASLDDSGRVVTVFSVSKSYAMTGWRIGYVAASREVATMLSKVQQAVTSCATAVAQKAAEAALNGDRTCIVEMRASYKQRRDRAVELLEEARLLVSRPRGAFYIMADTSPTDMGGYELCKRLVLEHGVAVAPGETFGDSGAGMVRISLASALPDLVEGVRRFTTAVAGWS
jgi:aspartate/methionine/tyrosine aminotransferase